MSCPIHFPSFDYNDWLQCLPGKAKLMIIENLFLGFTGLVVLGSLWSIFNGELFPPEPDPTGSMYNLGNLQR